MNLNQERMIVSSSARAPLLEMYPPEGKLPSLISDAREKPLVEIPTSGGTVLVKSPAFPYVEHHMLVIPDRADQGETSRITRVPVGLLTTTFATVGEVAGHYADNPEIQEINVGFNHSPLEDEKHVATQVNTLHVHVTGYTEADVEHTVSKEEIQDRPELKIKEKEPLAGLIKNILQHEVFTHMEEDAGFIELFNQVEDGDRVTYEMHSGIETFSDPRLAGIMHSVHERTSQAHDSIASCFFERDQRDTGFVETEDGRFKLLATDERTNRVNKYIETRSYLTDVEKRQLEFMATQADSMDEIHVFLEEKKGEELTNDEKYGRNPQMALKGLAYAAVFTGVKQPDDTMSWRFGIDPVVFAPRDVVQASRGTFAHFERVPDGVMPTEKLAAMRQDEERLKAQLISAV